MKIYILILCLLFSLSLKAQHGGNANGCRNCEDNNSSTGNNQAEERRQKELQQQQLRNQQIERRRQDEMERQRQALLSEQKRKNLQMQRELENQKALAEYQQRQAALAAEKARKEREAQVATEEGKVRDNQIKGQYQDQAKEFISGISGMEIEKDKKIEFSDIKVSKSDSYSIINANNEVKDVADFKFSEEQKADLEKNSDMQEREKEKPIVESVLTKGIEKELEQNRKEIEDEVAAWDAKWESADQKDIFNEILPGSKDQAEAYHTSGFIDKAEHYFKEKKEQFQEAREEIADKVSNIFNISKKPDDGSADMIISDPSAGYNDNNNVLNSNDATANKKYLISDDDVINYVKEEIYEGAIDELDKRRPLLGSFISKPAENALSHFEKAKDAFYKGETYDREAVQIIATDANDPTGMNGFIDQSVDKATEAIIESHNATVTEKLKRKYETMKQDAKKWFFSPYKQK